MDSTPNVPEQEPPAPHRESRIAGLGREAILLARTLLSAGVYATLIVTFVFQVARVEGHSMEPTLHDQDRLVVNKMAYTLHDPEVGDMVMMYHPNVPDQPLVKRIVAAPGDTIAFQGGVVVRNGAPADEAYIDAGFQSFDDRAPVRVPDGFYYVLGDHRKASSDSRSFGPVPRRYILGRIEVRWWPLPDVRAFEP
jgi:signal peptidase I